VSVPGFTHRNNKCMVNGYNYVLVYLKIYCISIKLFTPDYGSCKLNTQPPIKQTHTHKSIITTFQWSCDTELTQIPLTNSFFTSSLCAAENNWVDIGRKYCKQLPKNVHWNSSHDVTYWFLRKHSRYPVHSKLAIIPHSCHGRWQRLFKSHCVVSLEANPWI